MTGHVFSAGWEKSIRFNRHLETPNAGTKPETGLENPSSFLIQVAVKTDLNYSSLFVQGSCKVTVEVMVKARLRLDPWPADYESPFQIDDFDDAADEKVDNTVEGIPWQAVPPPKPRPRLEPLHFVDGVRRVEARVIVDDGSGQIIRGLFGSAAVGAVRVEQEQANFEGIRVVRYLIAGTGRTVEGETLKVGNTELFFEPCSEPDASPTAPLQCLQNLMRTEEASLAESVSSESACVFADGPLTYFTTFNLSTVGVVKRLFKSYLDAQSFALVYQLAVGERTPIFAITDGKYDRYSWYLRVGKPRTMDHAAAGVLRLELRSGVGLSRAIELADLSATCIPAFVAESFRDPRAPQNLLPVGSLEQELRHRLGDGLTIRRTIEESLFASSS